MEAILDYTLLAFYLYLSIGCIFAATGLAASLLMSIGDTKSSLAKIFLKSLEVFFYNLVMWPRVLRDIF